MSSGFEESAITRRYIVSCGGWWSGATHYPSAKRAIFCVFCEATGCIGTENPPHLTAGLLPFQSKLIYRGL